jgi:cytochrome b pre-mRNA-processing protein 3
MPTLFSRKRTAARLAGELYGPIVARARHPGLYRELGVADTLDGRFEMLVVHVVVLLRRLRALGEGGLAQEVIDLMFADLDQALREMGVSDISVASKIRPMAEAYAGRARAYEASLAEAAGTASLADALARNVFADAGPPGGVGQLADYVRRLEDALARMDVEDMAAPGTSWPEPALAP